MEKEREILIIIPAYNEGKTIGKLLDDIAETPMGDKCDILVMNDCSRDNTAEVVKSKGHKVVNHIFNLGYGCGLQTGYKYASKRNYKYVIQMDADGQHDPDNIEKLYKAITTPDEDGNTPDIILGSRFLKDSPEYKSTFAKNVGYAIFNTLIRFFTGKKITDPTTGLQALSRRTFVFYSKFNNFDEKYPDANMITQMLLLGYRVKEIPARMHQRTEGTSMHSGLKPILYMIKMMYMIFAVWIRFGVFKIDRN